MDSLQIEHRSDASIGVEIVAPQGEIDISNVEDLERGLCSALVRRPRWLLVDLSRVAYLDSAGITVLLHARRAIHRLRGELVLGGASPFIRRLFQMIGVGRLFAFHETVAEALAAVKKAAHAPSHTGPARNGASPETSEALLTA